MTSSCSKRIRLASLAAVALALALAGAGCREPEVVATNANIIRTSNQACAASDGSAAHMDTYVLEMYEVLPAFQVSNGQNVTDCRRCIANPEWCRYEGPTCSCGGEMAATPTNLKDQVRGTRIRGLDSTDLYCLRLVAFETGQLGQDDATPCPCLDEWHTSMDFKTSWTRLCAISPPRGAGALDVTLDVRCPSDDFNSGGGGGGRNNQLSFNDCVFPTNQ